MNPPTGRWRDVASPQPNKGMQATRRRAPDAQRSVSSVSRLPSERVKPEVPWHLPMQQWPNFDSNGDLQVGIYRATLSEVIAHFGTSTLQRRLVAQRLTRIYTLAHRTGQL